MFEVGCVSTILQMLKLPDGTVKVLVEGQQRARVDANSQLSEDAAEAWMRSVETQPADFLKSRFAIEAAQPPVAEQ